MVRIRHFALIAASCVAASLPVRADDQKPAPVQPAFAPRLNDMMAQLRHFKLWYAGLVQNWPLANYELTQIRVAIADVKRFYANNDGSNMSVMTQAADDLEDAIKAKVSAKFVTAYAKLTAGCNACHEQTGFGFIKIREPRLSPLETSPFTDESFSGK
jgi:cytochrome c553